MKYCIFYNPLSRGNSHDEVLTKMRSLYGDDIIPYDVTKIQYADVIPTLAADDVLVICGGDGTLNHFVNATYDLNVTNEVLYYPAGSGNDFLRDTNESADAPFPVKKYISKLPTAKIIERLGGNKYLIEAEVYGDGIKMWLLSQGAWVKVTEPPELVEDIKNEISNLSQIYDIGRC